MDKHQKQLAAIPQISQILNHPALESYLATYCHDFVVLAVQKATNAVRKTILNGGRGAPRTRAKIQEQIVREAVSQLEQSLRPSLRKVINATGIILHTGLGRAPLPKEALRNIQKVAEGYCNLEFELGSGKRGKRTAHVEALLCHLTGAEAACVVNNNAAAVLLTLNTLAFAKETIVSRGQLVEIGGSFRIPEVMAKSGTRMVEVGTTNKTHLKDYQKALSPDTSLICVVHPSNYRVQGFTKEVPLSELVEFAQGHDLPVMQDLGGGILFDLRKHGLPYEPVARESIAAGVDVSTFSGDKVLGGPQSGIIVGKKKCLDLIKSNPLLRALRCDKLVYAALEPTLKHYLQQEQLPELSQVFRMLLEPVEHVEKRAERVRAKVCQVRSEAVEVGVVDSTVQMGSGALPLEALPSKALCLSSSSTAIEKLARAFRMCEPALVGYVRDDRLFFDLRTVPEEDEPAMIAAFEP